MEDIDEPGDITVWERLFNCKFEKAEDGYVLISNEVFPATIINFNSSVKLSKNKEWPTKCKRCGKYKYRSKSLANNKWFINCRTCKGQIEWE